MSTIIQNTVGKMAAFTSETFTLIWRKKTKTNGNDDVTSDDEFEVRRR